MSHDTAYRLCIVDNMERVNIKRYTKIPVRYINL